MYKIFKPLMKSVLSHPNSYYENHGLTSCSVGRWPLTLDVEVPGLKPSLGTWWWGRIPPNHPFLKGTAPVATTLLIKC